MHKFLMKLLLDIKFKCPDCLRAMTYQNLKGHKGRGECQKGLQDEEDQMDIADALP